MGLRAEKRPPGSGPACTQKLQGVPVAGEVPRAPSAHCQGTLEQGAGPPNAQMGPCDELVTGPGMDAYVAGIGSSTLLFGEKNS